MLYTIGFVKTHTFPFSFNEWLWRERSQSIITLHPFYPQDDCIDIRNLDISVPADLKFNPDLELLPPPPPQMIPELTALEESTEERHWRSVVIGGVWHRIDMKVIAPYRKVRVL